MAADDGFQLATILAVDNLSKVADPDSPQVGSKAVQPRDGIQASTQAWRGVPFQANVHPSIRRAGIPSDLAVATKRSANSVQSPTPEVAA